MGGEIIDFDAFKKRKGEVKQGDLGEVVGQERQDQLQDEKIDYRNFKPAIGEQQAPQAESKPMNFEKKGNRALESLPLEALEAIAEEYQAEFTNQCIHLRSEDADFHIPMGTENEYDAWPDKRLVSFIEDAVARLPRREWVYAYSALQERVALRKNVGQG